MDIINKIKECISLEGDGGNASYSLEEKEKMFQFLDNIKEDCCWHSSEEKPDSNRCILIYNIDEDDYDVAYYESVDSKYIWIYFEDLLPFSLKNKYREREKQEGERLEEQYK